MNRRAIADDFEDDDREEPHEYHTDADRFERGAAFGGLEIRATSRSFQSGRVTAVLSGVTVDLRGASLGPEGATLDLQSAMSGIDVLVPPDWNVVCEVEAVCAGVSGGRSKAAPAAPGPSLRVRGTVVAGGLCVR